MGTVEFIRCGAIVFIHPLIGSRSGPRKFQARTFLALAGIAAVISMLLISVSAAPAPSHRIDVTAKRYSFEPAEITVRKGETIDLRLHSGDVPHGLRIRELNIDLHVGKGKTADATFTPQTAGTFVGHCSVFCGSGHGGMILTIHVVS